jgi:hypothetical protein
MSANNNTNTTLFADERNDRTPDLDLDFEGPLQDDDLFFNLDLVCVEDMVQPDFNRFASWGILNEEGQTEQEWQDFLEEMPELTNDTAAAAAPSPIEASRKPKFKVGEEIKAKWGDKWWSAFVVQPMNADKKYDVRFALDKTLGLVHEEDMKKCKRRKSMVTEETPFAAEEEEEPTPLTLFAAEKAARVHAIWKNMVAPTEAPKSCSRLLSDKYVPVDDSYFAHYSPITRMPPTKPVSPAYCPPESTGRTKRFEKLQEQHLLNIAVKKYNDEVDAYVEEPPMTPARPVKEEIFTPVPGVRECVDGIIDMIEAEETPDVCDCMDDITTESEEETPDVCDCMDGIIDTIEAASKEEMISSTSTMGDFDSNDAQLDLYDVWKVKVEEDDDVVFLKVENPTLHVNTPPTIRRSGKQGIPYFDGMLKTTDVKWNLNKENFPTTKRLLEVSPKRKRKIKFLKMSV